MKATRITLSSALRLLVVLSCSCSAYSQNAIFTYQGRLQDHGVPANGVYGMTFLLTDAATGGTALDNLIIPSITVSNGLFTTPLSFDPTLFDGTPRWLDISVQTNGGLLQTISPRQRITAAPYAIMANSASNLLGKLP